MNFNNNNKKRLNGWSKLIMAIAITLIVFQFNPHACLASTVVLQWDTNPDPTVTGYKVYYQADSSVQPFQGATPIDVKNQMTATISGLDPAHAYYFAVTAYNSSGVESAYSNILPVPELTPPTVSVNSPGNNATVNGTVSVAASASDNVGVTSLEFYVNGVLQATDTTAPYLYSWSTTSLAAGSYTLMSRAYDAAGNVSQSSDVVVTVVKDSTAPAVSVTAPTTNTIVNGTLTITANASDASGVSKVEFYANEVLLYVTNVPPYAYSWDTTSVSNGNYILTVKAYDPSGNVGQSGNVTVTISNVIPDTTAPTVSAFILSATATSLTVPVSSLTATDNKAVTGYLITESSTAPAASTTAWNATAPTTFTFSGAGSKTAYAWAKDAAGNVSASKSASVSITLPDTSAPTVSAFTMPASVASLTVSVSSLTATDNKAVTGYLITESSTAPAASATAWSATAPTTFTFSGAGAKTAYAWAKDAAGNVSAGKSASVTITLPDTTAPTVSITSPSNGTTVSGTVIIAATASDNVGVARVDLYINGKLTASDTASPFSFTWNTALVNNGSYILSFTAYDAAGNSRAGSVTVTVSNSRSTTVKRGDLNGDGKINIADALLALKQSVGLTPVTSTAKTVASAVVDVPDGDVAPLDASGAPLGDGKIDISDALVILKYSVGLASW